MNSIMYYRYLNWFSTMSVSTSVMFSPAAFTCCGMKLVAVIPGVVFISIMFTLSTSSPLLPTPRLMI